MGMVMVVSQCICIEHFVLPTLASAAPGSFLMQLPGSSAHGHGSTGSKGFQHLGNCAALNELNPFSSLGLKIFELVTAACNISARLAWQGPSHAPHHDLLK